MRKSVNRDDPHACRQHQGLESSALVEEGHQTPEEADKMARDTSRARVRARVEEIVEKEPKLAYLRQHEPDRFDEVAEIDHRLIKHPEHQLLPISERIALALKMYEAEKGVIVLPEHPPAKGAPEPRG
jgi:hypothetical protein